MKRFGSLRYFFMMAQSFVIETVATENENEVAIYNVISRDYVIDKDSIDFDELNKKSTTFLMWIKGDAYND